MATKSMRPPTPNAVFLSGDRTAVRRLALRRAAVSAMIMIMVALFSWETGLAAGIALGLLCGAVTYLGFAARGTRGLFRAEQDARSET